MARPALPPFQGSFVSWVDKPGACAPGYGAAAPPGLRTRGPLNPQSVIRKSKITNPKSKIAYSCLSASIGFIHAAFMAGYRPNPTPIRPLITNDPITLQAAITVG